MYIYVFCVQGCISVCLWVDSVVSVAVSLLRRSLNKPFVHFNVEMGYMLIDQA